MQANVEAKVKASAFLNRFCIGRICRGRRLRNHQPFVSFPGDWLWIFHPKDPDRSEPQPAAPRRGNGPLASHFWGH